MPTYDPTELARLQAKLTALQDMRDSGVLSIQGPYGIRISYQSGADLRAAIAELSTEIAALLGANASPRVRTARVYQSGTGY